MTDRNWTRAYYTVLAISVMLIPAAAYVGVRHVAHTIEVGEEWGIERFPDFLQVCYRVGPVGHSLAGGLSLLVIAALFFKRKHMAAVCLCGALLVTSVLLYLKSVASCSPVVHCVVEGTVVAGPSGGLPVENLVTGDAVWALSDEGTLQVGNVESIRSLSVGGYLHITCDNGRALRVTATQPVATSRSWKLANQLEPGDIVRTLHGTARVVSVVGARQPVTVYDLTIHPAHNYFADGFLVHNKIFRFASEDETPFDDNLVKAVQFKDVAGVRTALAAGADPNCRRGGRSVLHIAVEAANSEICTILIEAGADLTLRDVDGRTPTILGAMKLHGRSAAYRTYAAEFSPSEKERRQDILRMLEATDPAGQNAAVAFRDALVAYYAASDEHKSAREEEDEPSSQNKE